MSCYGTKTWVLSVECKAIVKPAAAHVDSELNCVSWLRVSSTAKIFGFGLRSGPGGI